MMANRKYDVIILGASGYTGQYVVEEFGRIKQKNERKFAISGRTENKLKNVLKIAAQNTGLNFDGTDIIITDVNDKSSIVSMAKQTKLVINCVGPYRYYGESVVEACIEAGADHIDISGEPQYLEQSHLKFDDLAEEKGVHVIGSCGFDSVPADMGTVFLQNNFSGDLNSLEMVVGLDDSSVGSAPINATTLECAVHGYTHRGQLGAIRRQLFAEKQPKSSFKAKGRGNLWWSEQANRWCVPNLAADRSVVMRSQYFNYKLYQRRPLQCNVYFGMKSFWSALSSIIFGLIFGFMTGGSWRRNLLLKYPSFFSFGGFSKSGAKREDLEGLKFRIVFIGRGWDSCLQNPEEEHPEPPNVTKIAQLTGPDPGYISTAIIVTQSALTLLEEKEKLPKKGGVFTPGTAFLNTTLIERLQERGIHFQMME